MKSTYMSRPAFYDLDALEPEEQIRRRFFLRHARDAHDVLELGCGTGLVGLFLAARGRHVTCVDRSTPLMDVVRTKVFCAPDLENHVTLVESDARFFLSRRRFDLVLLPDLMHLVHSERARKQILQNCHRLLRPNGRMIITFMTASRLVQRTARVSFTRRIGGIAYHRMTSVSPSKKTKNGLTVVWTFTEKGTGPARVYRERFECRCDEIEAIRTMLADERFAIEREFLGYDSRAYRQATDTGKIIIICRKAATTRV